MEIEQIIKIFRQKLPLIVAILLIALGSTWYASVKKPKKYEAGISFTVIRHNPTPQQKTQFYQYDNFYALQASGLFTDTIAQWVTSPATVVEVFQKTQIPLPESNLRSLTKIFRPRKQVQTANVVDITTVSQNKEQALSLMAGLSKHIEEKSSQLFGQDPDSAFGLSISQPVVVEQKSTLVLNLVVAAIIGLGLGVMAAFAMAVARGGARRAGP